MAFFEPASPPASRAKAIGKSKWAVRVRSAAQAPRKNRLPGHSRAIAPNSMLVQRNSREYSASMPENIPP